MYHFHQHQTPSQNGQRPQPTFDDSHRRGSALAGILATLMVITSACGDSGSAAGSPTTTTASAAPTSAPTATIDEVELQSRVDELIDLGVTGVALFVKDGDNSVVVTSGVSDLDTGTQLNEDDRFRIASLTKPYVATIVFQLVEEGRLTLDDTIEQWLPGMVPNGDQITVRELLDHTSGIADYFGDTVLAPYFDGDFAYAWTPQQLIEIANESGAVSTPGTEYHYSNTDYAIIGLIVETVTGRSLTEEMQSRIFDPLDLAHTTFATDATPDPTLARGYLLSDDPAWDVTDVFPFYWAAGNIVSDISDTATFFDALLSGKLLDETSLADMKPSLAGGGPGPGLFSYTFSCGVSFGHNGTVPGFNADVEVLEDGREVVLLANSTDIDNHPAPNPAAGDLWNEILELALCG